MKKQKLLQQKRKKYIHKKKPIKKIERIETSTKILDETEEITIIYPQKKPINIPKKD